MAVDLMQTLVNSRNIRYDPKLYVKDLNGAWVDFSDKTGNGADRLSSVGVISNKVEIGLGTLVTTIQNVTLRNGDGYFNRPLPTALRTVQGAAASFEVSIGYKRPVLKGRECKICVQVRIPVNTLITDAQDGPRDTIQEESIGHFFIDDVIPDILGESISLKLISQDGRLQKKDAGGIRNGYDWYSYRSVSFLIEQILLSEYGVEGSLPSTYDIDKSPSIPTLNNVLAVSNLGRPPLWDGTKWNSLGLYARAICFANVASTGGKLYLGCDNQLWSYDPSTGVYGLINDSTISSSQNIRHIFYDDDNDQLVIVAYEDAYWETFSSNRTRTGLGASSYTWPGTGTTLTAKATSAVEPFNYIVRTAYTLGGTPATNFIGYESSYATREHENVFIPFPQHVGICQGPTTPSTKKVYYQALDTSEILAQQTSGAVEQDDISVSGKADFNFCSAGMITHLAVSSDNNLAVGLRYFAGQHPCVMLSPYYASGTKLLYYFQYALSGNGYIYPLDSAGNLSSDEQATYLCTDTVSGTSTHRYTSAPAATGSERRYPLALFHGGSATRTAFWFSIRNDIYLDNDNGVLPTYINLIDLNNFSFSSSPFYTSYEAMFTDETGDDQYWTVINGCAFEHNTDSLTSWPGSLTTFQSQNNHVALSLFNRKTGVYALVIISIYDLYGASHTQYTAAKKLRFSSMPFTGFVADEQDTDVLYCYAVGEGKIYKLTAASTGSDGTCDALTESSIVANESGLLSGLALNQAYTTVPELYGVTSPIGPLEINYTYAPGKYVLFKVDDSISDIVEYAYFQDKTKWDIIKDLSQSRDGLSFFDREGNFRYTPRIYTSSTADYTIGGYQDGYDRSVFKGISLDNGYGRVYNIVKVHVYTTKFVGPDPSVLTTIERTDKNSQNKNAQTLDFIPYSVEQRDTAKKKILVYCVAGGNPDNGLSKWKYSVINQEIEVTVRGAVLASATTIPLNSVFGGGTLGTSGVADEGVHAHDFVSMIDESTGEVLTRTITSVSQDPAEIDIDSAFGVAIADATTLTVGRSYQIDSAYARTNWSDEGIGYVASADSTSFTLASGLATPLRPGHIVRLSNDYHEYRVTAWDNDRTFTVEQLENSGTAAWHSTPAGGEVVYAYWSPNFDYSGEIGDTHVFMKFEAGTGTAEVNYTQEFIPGDRIIVDCPGQTLAEDAGSLQVVMAGDSGQRYGRSEFDIDNPFISREIAKELANRVIYYYSNPKFLLTISLPLTPYVDIVNDDGDLTQIDVVLPLIFDSSAGLRESFRIQAISHDIKGNTTTLTLSGISAY